MLKMDQKILILAAVVIIVLVVAFLLLTGKPEPEATGPKLSADKVDVIPNIPIQECLDQIKTTNPEMSDSVAQDNCWAIEAVNKGDSSLCDEISSADVKTACLAQF